MPNADPINIDLLRAKHPEPAHPDRDPVSSSSKLWPRPQNLEEYWSSDAGAVKGPTSPRIVTSKQLSKHAWNAAHCTVNTFIHKHPNHLTVPGAWSKSSSKASSREPHKKPREQYLF